MQTTDFLLQLQAIMYNIVDKGLNKYNQEAYDLTM